MAAPVVAQGNSGLSHKQRRAALKKERRKKKRQELAKLRDSELAEEDGEDETLQDAADDDEERKAEEERQRLHLEWLERERIAQEQFQQNREREEAAMRKKEEEERRIKEEWDGQQKKEQEALEQKQQEKRDREAKRYSTADHLLPQEEDEAVQKMLDEAESQLENGGRWHNPEAPQDYGTEKDRANCPFFIKTGACRFGDRCSRKHVHPAASTTLMIRGMFVNFGMDQSRRDDYDTDASLEYSEEEVQQQFLEFYEDVLPEFSNVGKVLQFKVSCNFEPHLRGNVYVQYETEDECREAFMQFNGRWYAGKQLQCEFSPVTRWKMAICGLFDRHKCPRGKHCNFLHVYRNPGNQFWEADRDLHMSPDRGSQFTGRFSERRDRSRRRYSRSPDGSHRRNGESDRRRSGYRSRSRERRRRQCSSSPERSRRRRSRSRERRRSHSRERHRSKGRSPSRSRSRERARRRGLHAESKSRPSVRKSGSRSPSGEGASRAGEPSLRRAKRSGSGGSPERARDKHSKSKSPGHKHVKKSKKKKGKKKKKKKNRKKSRSRSPSGSSSADSGKNSEGEGETAPQDSETPAAQEALQEDSVPDEQGEEGTGSGPATS